MSADKYMKVQRPRLPDSVFIQTAAGDHPEDEERIWNPIEQEMELVPDVGTRRVVPWVTESTAQIIHDCYYLNGDPVDLWPRYVLRRMLDLFRARGLEPLTAPEAEFYLVRKNTDPDHPLEAPVGRSGGQGIAHQSNRIDALNEYDPLFEQMYDYCEAMELEIDTRVEEEGSGQMEINFQHGCALDLADRPVPPLPRRAAALPARGAGLPGTQRQLISPPGPGQPGRADQCGVGHGESHRWSARAAWPGRCHARREPDRRRGRQSVCRHRGHAGLRLPRYHALESSPAHRHRRSATRPGRPRRASWGARSTDSRPAATCTGWWGNALPRPISWQSVPNTTPTSV